jgi:hypothetical protein
MRLVWVSWTGFCSGSTCLLLLLLLLLLSKSLQSVFVSVFVPAVGVMVYFHFISGVWACAVRLLNYADAPFTHAQLEQWRRYVCPGTLYPLCSCGKGELYINHKPPGMGWEWEVQDLGKGTVTPEPWTEAHIYYAHGTRGWHVYYSIYFALLSFTINCILTKQTVLYHFIVMVLQYKPS